ncbi:MAG: hypothetical protein VXY92_00260 [Planctomycetota bacterium]|nr:hypothetical protein [Planctomycetota bacterium]
MLALAAFQLFSCRSTESTWEAYQWPDTSQEPVIRAAANEGGGVKDGSCAKCHQGCSDPHPGGRQATCVHCHGGDPTTDEVVDGRVLAHPQPKFPEEWLSSGNPERAYMLTMAEDRDWVQFVNPGDLRVANKTCGPCHEAETLQVMKSLMNTSQHFWGTVTYANGIVSAKRSILGESYGPDGKPQIINHIVSKDDEDASKDGGVYQHGEAGRAPTPAELEENSWSAVAVPLPHWEVTQPSNIFRIFERGSRLGTAALGLNGLNTPIPGLPDKFEDPGRPNNRSSDRGLGTLNRVDLPTLNVHKTRLNDPHLAFLGTNDQPGDFRSSGCTSCHMVYANDRDPVHSGPYAQFGNLGHGNFGAFPNYRGGGAEGAAYNEELEVDPQIPQGEQGHPIAHRFTKAVPSSNCMVCHMHQPNSFLNTYYGYQMWSYETDGDKMFAPTQEEKSIKEQFDILDRNPEGAAQRGKWGDRSFLDGVAETVNKDLEHTQFADYHGHGWIFRGVFKTDRKGNLLDKDGNRVDYDDPKKFEGVIPKLGSKPTALDIYNPEQPDAGCFRPQPGKPVHLKDVHAEVGMHCVDCHFAQDVHGDTHLYSEYQAAIQITCQDCHGTATERASFRFSGPAAKVQVRSNGQPYPDGRKQPFGDQASPQTPWGQKRFYKDGDGRIVQRSMMYPGLEWRVSQVVDSVTPGHDEYNEKAAYAKLQTKADGSCAHSSEQMDCAACHTSWMTSCFGCHLPQEANWRTDMHHFEKKKLRNWASYNPQVARDDVFMLGVMPTVKWADADTPKYAAVRSSSAVMVSSTDATRGIAYKQQLTVAANGMNGQCFNTHFAHTVRKTETRKCSDCHLSDKNDNNAWLAQTYLQGTGYVNFFGMYAYVGAGEGGLEAVKVTEWPEPQAMIGSNLHGLAFPEEHAAHRANAGQLQESHHHGGNILSIEQRGEYVYTATGAGGFRVYDVANVANKNFSERIVTAPVSPLGQDTHVATKFATAVALPTNMSISMDRPWIPENQEQAYEYRGKTQNLHESYRYAYVSDRYEGLVLVDIDCLTDGDPDNNFTERALAFNPGGVLNGAENLAVAGTTVYVCCEKGLAVVDIDDPLAPKLLTVVPMNRPTSVAVQFRYAFVTDAEGLKVVDVTFPAKAAPAGSVYPIADARNVYVARDYAYVAAGAQGVVFVDVSVPTALKPVVDPQTGEQLAPFQAAGRLTDVNRVRIGMVNDSVYALVADGQTGLHVLQVVTPMDGGRSAYGFSPAPRPTWIANYPAAGARAIARGLDRDRAADESGNQVSVFGRIGGRPFTLEEQRRFYVRPSGELYTVSDDVPDGWQPKPVKQK